jgi:hypothetical protein
MRELLETLRRVLVLALACALLLAGGEAARGQTGTAPQAAPPSELWKAFPLDPGRGRAEPIPPSGETPSSGVGIGREQSTGPRPPGSDASVPPGIELAVALAAAVLLAWVFLTRGGPLARVAHELAELGQPGRERLLRREHGQAVFFSCLAILMSCALGVVVAYLLA